MSISVRLAVIALSIALAGCMPVVHHGPEVRPGFTGGLSASYPLGPTYMEGDWGDQPFMYGPVGINLSQAWRNEEKGGLLLAAHIPGTVFLAPHPRVLGSIAQLDVYYQLPERVSGSTDVGLGVNAARTHVMPYAQFGRIQNGSGWYTTQGVGVMMNENMYEPHEIASVAWLPTVAYQMGRARHTIHWFVSGGVGTEFGVCHYGGYCTPDEKRYLLTAGATVQFHAKR